MPHDPPSAAELVAAVRELLERDVLDATTGRVRFHTRVAVNVLAMVERELALGPTQAAAHAERLAALGYADDAALASAVRAGELDDRRDELVAALRAAVADKLAVANPRYAQGGEADPAARPGSPPKAADPTADRTGGRPDPPADPSTDPSSGT